MHSLIVGLGLELLIFNIAQTTTGHKSKNKLCLNVPKKYKKINK